MYTSELGDTNLIISNFIYRIDSGGWSKIGELNAVRAGHRVINNQDFVMVVGGLQ